jgi:hypothetical protein
MSSGVWNPMKTLCRTAGAVLVALVLSSCSSADSQVDEVVAVDPLDEIRAATAKYQDINVALAEGFIPDPMGVCEDAANFGLAADLGAMGLHYFRPDLLQVTATEPLVDGTGIHTDFTQPAVLIYEPQADGSLELVAIENLAFAAAWTAAGNTEPPSFQDLPFDYMADDPVTEMDEAHMFTAHYDRHVWLYRENPNGMFAQFNPAVTCEHHAAAADHAH